MIMRPASILSFAAIWMLLGGCGESPSESDPGVVYEVSVEGNQSIETFRIRLEDPQLISEAEQLLTSGQRRNVSGTLQRGDGGFNAPYPWHMTPATVGFPEATIELCDGRPSEIAKDLDYWMNTVKQYCPWGSWISHRVSGSVR